MNQNRKIFEAIIWFDIFDWPLNSIELKKYTGAENLPDIYQNSLSGTIEFSDGFYFLKGRKVIIKKRILRQKTTIKKIKIGKLAAKILSLVPFVKMTAICNDLAYFNAPEESDIDFFVVVKSGRIWLTRFLATFILFALGLWRHGKKIKDRICLSFFIADDDLNLKNIAYDDDIYLKYWILQILPLFCSGVVYQKFLKENSWTTDEFPNFFQNIPSLKIKVQPKFLQMVLEKILNGWLGNLLENFLRRIQLKIMGKNIPWQKEKDVIISDKMLKFHEKDRRKHFKNIFEKKLIEINRNL